MNRTSALIKRAEDIRRKLFRSQSPTVRIAYVMAIIAGTDPLLKALGRSLGAVFIMKKTEGLPDVQGKPALEWAAALPKQDMNTIMSKLQSLAPDYLDKESARLRQSITGKFGLQEATDVISDWMTRFIAMGGWKHLQEGQPLDRALNYCLVGLKNQALNRTKGLKRRQREDSIDDAGDDEDRRPLDLADPNSAKDFFEDSPTWKAPKVRKILEQKVHPDAPMFLDLLYQGYTVRDIIGDKADQQESMLPHVKEKPMSYYNWSKTYMPKIEAILDKFDQEVARS